MPLVSTLKNDAGDGQVLRLRWAIPLAFTAAVFAMYFAKPPICLGLYIGAVIYAAFLPAGLLAQWRLSRAFPLAFAAYFLALIAAGLIAVIPQIGAEFQRLQRAQAEFFARAATCPLGTVAVGVQALILAPLVEETLFRGILFEEVKRKVGTVAAYLVSSALFAVLHSPGLGALPIFVISLALAYAYHKHGLISSVLIHFTQNFIAFAVAHGGV